MTCRLCKLFSLSFFFKFVILQSTIKQQAVTLSILYIYKSKNFNYLKEQYTACPIEFGTKFHHLLLFLCMLMTTVVPNSMGQGVCEIFHFLGTGQTQPHPHEPSKSGPVFMLKVVDSSVFDTKLFNKSSFIFLTNQFYKKFRFIIKIFFCEKMADVNDF